MAETPLATLKAFMAARFLSDHAAVLPSEIDTANFDFYGKVLNGAQEQRPRWKRAIETVGRPAGRSARQDLCRTLLPASSKDCDDTNWSANLRKALGQSLEQNELDERRDQGAGAKPSSTASSPRSAIPTNSKPMTGWTINAADPLGNAHRRGASGSGRRMSRALGKPIDRAEWFMLPQTVNAYYNPSVQRDRVSRRDPAAAVLRARMPIIAVNYGAIGGVIGHEMGHGFDDQGSKYDADRASCDDWWTEPIARRFDALGDTLAAQYDKFCPLDEGKTCVNGRLTLGENIGDLSAASAWPTAPTRSRWAARKRR